MRAEKHKSEEARLAALHRYAILDTAPEQDFDDITRLIAHICQTPIAVVNLVDRDRQWFKAEVGLGVNQTPIDSSICAHAILEPDITVIEDAQTDHRLSDNPLVTGNPHLRFYAGSVLQSADGYPIGTLCVLDYVPRKLTDAQIDALRILSREVMSHITLRKLLADQAVLMADRKIAQDALAQTLAREQKITHILQDSLLTMPRPDAFPHIGIAHVYRPAWDEASVGGDFCDAFSLPGGGVALVVGDVSGKGLTAAARLAEVRYLLRAFLRQTSDPAQALTLLNTSLCEARALEGEGDTALLTSGFTCACVLVLDGECQTATFASAGMEPLLVVRANGQTESGEVFGLPLGVSGDMVYANYPPIALSPGDTLLLATDGITEAHPRKTAARDFLGYDGLTRLAQDTASLALPDMAQAILDGATAWSGGRLYDDACLLLARPLPR